MKYIISEPESKDTVQNDSYRLKIDASCVNDVPAGILNCLDVGYTYTNIGLNQFQDLIYHIEREKLLSVSEILIIIGMSNQVLNFECLSMALNYIDCLSAVMHRKGVRGQCHIVMEEKR